MKLNLKRRQTRAYENIELPQAPWMNKHYPLDEMYVNLVMDNVQGECQRIAVNELFHESNDGREAHRILVEGPPGMGKTTLCCKLARDWSGKKDYIRAKFQLVFLFELRNYQEGDDIETILFRECEKEKRCTKNDIMRYINENQSQILLILDGFDELSEEGKHVFLPLIRKDKYKDMYVLTTSRNGMFQFNKLQEIQLIGRLERYEKNPNNLYYFDKRIRIHGIDKGDIRGFLVKYFHEVPQQLECQLHSISEGLMSQVCECPLFLLLLAMILQEKLEGAIESFPSQTSLYKFFVTFIIRRDLVREKRLGINENVDLFKDFESHSSTNTYLQTLASFGRLACEKLITDVLVFGENEILKYSDEIVLKSGILVKTSQVKSHQKEVHYQPIHKTFIEFIAAFSVFYELSKSNNESLFKGKIETLIKKGLIPTNDSLFYVFLGGFLDGRAHLLFEALTAYGYWFNLENRCFTNILLEVENIDVFFSSFQHHLPSFVPTFHSIGNFYSVKENFFSTKIYSLIINHSIELNLVQVLQWDPSFTIDFSRNLSVERLRLIFKANISEENFTRLKCVLKCKSLHVTFTNEFSLQNWHRVVSFIESIERENVNVSLLEGGDLNSVLFDCLYDELHKHRWRSMNIGRLRLKFADEDRLQKFVELVKTGRIIDGITVGVQPSQKYRGNRLLKKTLQKLFDAVAETEKVRDFYAFYTGETFSPVFDFCREKSWRSIYFEGSLTLSNSTNSLVSVEEAFILPKGDEDNTSKFIGNFVNNKFLCCRIECFESLLENNHQGLKVLDELELYVDEAFHLDHIIPFKNITVLTLDFEGIKSLTTISSNPTNIFKEIMSCMNLRILELLDIPEIPLFRSMIEGIMHGLFARQTPSSKVQHLQELGFNIHNNFNGIGKNDIRWIQEMLRGSLGRCCWVDYSMYSSRDPLYFLFPYHEGYRIKASVVGTETTSSRRSQYYYRSMGVAIQHCITWIRP